MHQVVYNYIDNKQKQTGVGISVLKIELVSHGRTRKIIMSSI